MPKTTAIERALAALNQQIAAIRAARDAEIVGLEAAVDALKAQQRTRKPKGVKRTTTVADRDKAVAQPPLN